MYYFTFMLLSNKDNRDTFYAMADVDEKLEWVEYHFKHHKKGDNIELG